MKHRIVNHCIASAVAAVLLASAGVRADDPRSRVGTLAFENETGVAATIDVAGPLDLSNPFFQNLGSNGRACVSCHQPAEGWTVTPSGIRARFLATGGTDPIFRTNDGSHSPLADVSTLPARIAAYDMLLTKGLIRVGIGIPANAEFELVGVDDPYGYASAAELSLFRRPLPATNLRFLNTVMWDGRETFLDPTSTMCVLGTSRCYASLHFDLADQSNAATTGHAQGTQDLSTEQRDAIVAFESSLYTAQVYDRDAGVLDALGARGGPGPLVDQASYFGINDVVSGDYRSGASFDGNVFSLYGNWDSTETAGNVARESPRADARMAIARGEKLFNTRVIQISGVKGLNDDFNVPVLDGSCSTCHDAPNAGDHSVPMPLNIGVADASRRTPDLPLYTLRNLATGEIVQTTDPGRALITGKWNDIGKFKGPTLRGLAIRAPYFHNGSAADLDAVVDFYNQRFSIGLTAQEHGDLVAFLRSL